MGLIFPKSNEFLPTDLPGLKLWMAGDRSPHTLNVGNVSQADDLSGLGNHPTQVTASLQSAYVADAINGLPGIQSDGVDDLLTLPNAFNNDYLFDATVKSVFVAFRVGGALQSNKRIFTGRIGGSARFGLFSGGSAVPTYHYRNAVPALVGLGDGSTPNFVINTDYIMLLRQNGASIEGYLNSSTPTATAADGNTAPEAALSPTDIGGPGTNVTISEIVVTAITDPTDAEVALTLDYMSNKYGVTLA